MSIVLCMVVCACDGGTEEPDGGREVDSSPASIDAGRWSDGRVPAPDAGGSEDAGSTSPPEVSFTLPGEDTVRVNGEVTLQLVVRNAMDDDDVEIWKDGAILAILPPPYTYDWDSDADSEGAHVLAAVVRRGGEELARAERELIVDRSPPTIIERSPEMDGTALWTDPVRVRFSEPVFLDPTTDVTLRLNGAPATFTVEKPEADTVLLTLTEPPASLPATATVTVGRAVRDTLGFELGNDVVWSFRYPGWAPRASGPPDCQSVHDAEVDSTDRLWLLYVTSMATGNWDLQVASWDGVAWTMRPSPRPGASYIRQAELSIGPTDEVAVAWTGEDIGGDSEIGVRVLDGTTWVDLPGLPRADDYSHALDLVHQGDGALALSRTLGRDYVVHRHDGTWSQVGTTRTSSYTAYVNPDLLWTPGEGLRMVWGLRYDCWTAVESGGEWVDLEVIAGGVSSPGCRAVTLLEPGGSAFTPTIHAFIEHNSTGRIRWVTGEGVPTITVYPRRWLHVVSKPTGFLALANLSSGTIQLVDETNNAVVVDDPSAAKVAFVAGEALVINETGDLLAPIRLTP